MSIISALPYTLQNGTTADATQVMANFNQIVTDVNTNLALPLSIANGGTGSTFGPVPVGTVTDFAGTAAPTGWFFCYGQAVSRAGFPNLFSALGTAWGVGDGSTTFNLPDLRGRAAFGKDDMGGSAANRITNAVSGMVGTTLGVVGGDQRIGTHTHPLNMDLTGAHAIGVNGVALGTNNTAGSAAFDTPLQPPAGAGNSANMPPTAIMNKIIRGDYL